MISSYSTLYNIYILIPPTLFHVSQIFYEYHKKSVYVYTYFVRYITLKFIETPSKFVC
jgi:hypothetical protein